MFSTKEQLEKRTGEHGTGRSEYLAQLVKEFQETQSVDAKQQILGNLANFAYDPINYDFLRKLKVIDIFLDHLSEESEIFQEFSVAGLCNLVLDPVNRTYVLHQKGVSQLEPLLQSSNQEIVLNTIATLMFLVTRDSKPEIASATIVEKITVLRDSPNIRISNMAKVFLTDYVQNAVSITARSNTQRLLHASLLRNCQENTLEIGNSATISRKITLEDVKRFGEISGDVNPVHFSENAVVHGAFLNALVSCVMGTRVPGAGSMVVSQALKYPNPCYVGDKVTVDVTVSGMKADLIKCRYTIIAITSDKNSRPVLTGEALLIMRKNQEKRAAKNKAKRSRNYSK